MLCPRCKAVFSDAARADFVDPGRCPRDGWKLVVDRAGKRLERFEILSFLGVGGGGASVWSALEHGSKDVRKLAVKLLPVGLSAADEQEVTRFERGALLAQSLHHPHIAKVFGHGRLEGPDGPLAWLSMELLEGQTLSELAATRRYSPIAAVTLIDQALDALELAHGAGIVHRDLKPSNLHVASTAEPARPHLRVLDFGIARLTGKSAAQRFGPFFPDDDPIAPALEAEVTGEHRICGTPEYMAPEQILGAPPDPRSDLYAMGVVLYRLITGQLPFRGRTRYELYHRHLHEVAPVIPPSLGVPIPLAASVHRALAKQPEARFETARAMRDALRMAVGLPPLSRPRLFPTESELPRVEVEVSVVAPAMNPLPSAAAEIRAAAPPTSPRRAASPQTHEPTAEVPRAPLPVWTPPPPARRTGRAIGIALGLAALIGLGLTIGAAVGAEPVAAHPPATAASR